MKIILIALLFLVSSAKAQTNFSGNWILNKDKSDFGEAPASLLPTKLDVSQFGQKVSFIETKLNNDNTLYLDTVKLVPDQATITKVNAANRIRKYTLQWGQPKDGFTMTCESLRLNGSAVGTFSMQWTLSANGKELLVRQHSKQANGLEYEMRACYDRQ